MGAHNAFWHGVPGGIDTAGGGPKQHLLDDVYIDRMRALELDLHSNRSGRNWRVYHTSFDAHYSLCEVFDDCLRVARAFHYGNPNHDPFFLHLESKETGSDALFDFDQPGTLHLTPEDLDQTIERLLGDGQPPYANNWIFGPADYYAWCQERIDRGELPAGTALNLDDLKDAVRKCGWPTMEFLRGRFIVTMHGSHLNNESYVWEYSHRDGRTIGSQKIFPMASVQGIGSGFCSQVDMPESGNGLCNWGNHSVFADVQNLDGGQYPPGVGVNFGLDPSRHIREFMGDGGMIRVSDRNNRGDMADGVRTVFDLKDAPGANLIPGDAPRNMLVNYTHGNLAGPTLLDGALNWSAGCLFEPNPTGESGHSADEGFFGYFRGCMPEALREESSGIFVAARNLDDGLRGTADRIVFVHRPRKTAAGSFRAFVSTRTDELGHGFVGSGNWGCLMARENVSDPGAKFFAVCRRWHRNSWDSNTDGAYLLYRDQPGGTISQYYDQPHDGLGTAEIQNFFRLHHSADGKCWTGYLQSTDDPAPAPGWGEITLRDPSGREEICFDTDLTSIGLAMDGGHQDTPGSPNQGHGEYLFANVRYNGGHVTLAELAGTAVIEASPEIAEVVVRDRSYSHTGCRTAGTACTDGDPCTRGDTCDAQLVCRGTPVTACDPAAAHEGLVGGPDKLCDGGRRDPMTNSCVLEAGGATVSISLNGPPLALPTAKNINVISTAPNPLAGACDFALRNIAGKVVSCIQLEPSGTQFGTPVTATFKWTNVAPSTDCQTMSQTCCVNATDASGPTALREGSLKLYTRGECNLTTHKCDVIPTRPCNRSSDCAAELTNQCGRKQHDAVCPVGTLDYTNCTLQCTMANPVSPVCDPATSTCPASCDSDANSWTVKLSHFSEYALGFTPPPPDHFQCYTARLLSTTPVTAPLTLVDQFGTVNAAVIKPLKLCSPTNKNDEDPEAVSHPDYLQSYAIRLRNRRELEARLPVRGLQITDQFGTHVVDVRLPDRLLVPSATGFDSVPPAPSTSMLDHFTCYKVKRPKGTPRFTPLDVTAADAFNPGNTSVRVRQPAHLCVPTNKNNEAPGAENDRWHLLCYRASPPFTQVRRLYTNNQFGPSQVYPLFRQELCVPALLD